MERLVDRLIKRFVPEGVPVDAALRAWFRESYGRPSCSEADEVVSVPGDGLRPGEALNRGLKSVRSPFVLFLDDDCVLAAGAIRRMVATASAG